METVVVMIDVPLPSLQTYIKLHKTGTSHTKAKIVKRPLFSPHYAPKLNRFKVGYEIESLELFLNLRCKDYC